MKSNDKKICLNTSLKGLLLVPLFLLSLGFIGITSASASAVVTHLTPSGNYITIPDYDGETGVLFCHSYSDTLTIDDESFSSLFFNEWNSYYSANYGWYTFNPSVGSHLIAGTSWTCDFVTGINITGNFYDTFLVSSSLSSSEDLYVSHAYFPNISEDSFVYGFFTGASNTGDSAITSIDANVTYTGGYGYQNQTLFNFIGNGANPYSVNFNRNFYWFNPANPVINYYVLNTDIQPTGLSIQENVYNPVNGNVFLSGTCEQKGSGVYQMNLYAYTTGTSTPNYMESLYPERESLVSCIDGTWTAMFNGTGLTGSNRLVIDDSFYGTEIASVDINWQNVTGSILFNYGKKSTININSNVSGGATTTIDFIYNICDDPNYSATSSKIWLVQQDGTNYQTEYWEEEYTYQTPTCSGTGQISFYVAQGAAGAFRAYFAYANSYNVPILKSGYFYISVVNNQKLATTTVAQLLGDTARNLACTEEEWNTINDGFLGFNYTRTICAAKAATFDTFNIISNAITNLISVTINKVLANVFPLTIPINFVQSWNESQVTALPESLSWLNATDEDGDISVGFPKEWTGGDTDTNFKLFGSHMLTENPKAALFFSRIRNFLIYVFYALWLLKMKEAAEDFYDEWMAEGTRMKHDKNNYQL